MKDKELSALKALAEAATPGPWVMHLSDNATPYITHGKCPDGSIPCLNDLGNRICVMPAEISTTYNSYANGKFIAAANPATILPLISRLEQAEAASAERSNNAIDQTILAMREIATTSTKYADGEREREVTGLDILSLIHSQCHRVYASAIDREEIDSKYMAEIEQALKALYADAKLGRQQAPVGDSVDTPEFRKRFKYMLRDEYAQLVTDLNAWKDAQLARERQEADFDVDLGALKEQSEAWFSVCNVLTELCPSWRKSALRGMDSAVATIRSLAAQAQGEPVAWACPQDERHAHLEKPDVAWGTDNPWDTGYGAFPLYLGHAPQADEVRDAQRYRWLRMQSWFDGPMCILKDPKRVLTKGMGLGADCPSLNRLDSAIDAAMRTTAADNQKGGAE